MSDHISGPRAIADPVIDITDVYAFPCPESPQDLVLIMNVFPYAGPCAVFSNAVIYRLRVRSVSMAPDGRAFAVAADESIFDCTFSRTQAQECRCALPTGDVITFRVNDESGGKGKGSCFTLEFPTTNAIKKRINRITGTLAEQKPARRTRVLLVDDHQDTLRVLRRLLESLGYQVTAAASVSAAVSYAAANEIDALVSDIGLPDASGHDLMRKIKQIQNVPGVAVSGFGLETDVQNSRDAGFFAHLTKPINLHLLHSTLQQALRNELPMGTDA